MEPPRDADPLTHPDPAPEPPDAAEHPAPDVKHEPEPDAENIMPAEHRPGTL